MDPHAPLHPGRIVLFGSGETLASSGKTHEYTAQQLGEPPRISILETPAGFEPNSDRVAGRIGEFLARRLQNYQPEIQVLPARQRGTPFSPDEKAIVAPILRSNWLLLGPGSPSYAVRQLRDSLALHMIRARHHLGATLMLSSSATLAFSAHALPVYEIYKVGEDLHWKPGLDYFDQFGLSLIVIPHWNNRDGGDELDTSHCYMGQARFEQLRQLLPARQTILGIDEHTALVIDLVRGECRVMGSGRVTILRQGEAETDTLPIPSGRTFLLATLGDWHLPPPGSGVPPHIWAEALAAQAQLAEAAPLRPQPSPQVLSLVQERTAARSQRQWQTADQLRQQILALGWQVMDAPDGPELEPIPR